MSGLADDLRLAFRSLSRHPSYTAAVVLILAGALGTQTAMFGLLRAVLLAPLPYPHPERIVRFVGNSTQDGLSPVSLPNVDDVRRRSRSLACAAAVTEWQPVMVRNGTPESLSGISVSAPFFDVLGLRPVAGRFFIASEDVPGSSDSVVLSSDLWRSRWGGDPEVVGHRIELNRKSYTVIGIAPANAIEPALVAVAASPQIFRVSPGYFAPNQSSRDGFAFQAIGRLRPRVSLRQAQDEIARLMTDLRRQYPADNKGHDMRLVEAREPMVAPVRPALRVLALAVGLVLLTACANVAQLQLARGIRRQRELAVRVAVGAGRSRIARQLLLESLIAATLAGALGVALSTVLLAGARGSFGGTMPRLAAARVDGVLMLFALATAAFASVAFGTAPALLAGAAATRLARRGHYEGDRGHRLFSHALVVGEVAISVALAVAGALLAGTLWHLSHVNLGFSPDHVVTAAVSPQNGSFEANAAITALYARLEERLKATPGVRAAGFVDILPLSGDFNRMLVRLDDRPAPLAGEWPSVEMRIVSPGYFQAVGTRVVVGRGLRSPDSAAAMPVAAINVAMAGRFWPGRDPLGKHLVLGSKAFNQISWEVVGVVTDERLVAPGEKPTATLYLPHAQVPAAWMRQAASWVVNVTRPTQQMLVPIASALQAAEPSLVVEKVRPLTDVVGGALAPARLRAVTLGAFTAVGLALAVIGLYSVLAFAVAERGQELAIRSSLGATRGVLLRSVVGRAAALAGVGAAGGLGLALAASRLLGGLLFGVRPAGWAVWLAAGAAAVGITALASWIPGRRAAGTDPALVLRGE